MLSFENRDKYLFAEYSGPYSFPTAMSGLQEIAETCKREGLDKVLIDVRPMHGFVSIIDRFSLGMEFIRLFGSSIRLAVINERSRINYVMENVIVNRYGKAKAFTDFEEAIRWLGIEKSS